MTALRGAIGAAAAVLLFAAAGACAQTLDTGNVAVLVQAPVSRRGIDGLGPNVLPCLVASYSFTGAAVRVTYTDAAIPPFASWPAAPCAALRVKLVPPGASGGGVKTASLVLSYADPQGWDLFFAFPNGFPSANACVFVSRFVPRFQYFLGATEGGPLSSFPAVLQP